MAVPLEEQKYDYEWFNQLKMIKRTLPIMRSPFLMQVKSFQLLNKFRVGRSMKNNEV
jgi:hypothetical protein